MYIAAWQGQLAPRDIILIVTERYPSMISASSFIIEICLLAIPKQLLPRSIHKSSLKKIHQYLHKLLIGNQMWLHGHNNDHI